MAVQVDSSNLAEVDYSDGVLTIWFHSGGVYRYRGVPHSVYVELLNAPSKGRYHARHIKYAYPYERVR